MSQPNTTHAGVAAVLAMTMALVPLALDTYLPAFPLIASSLDISVHDVAKSVAVYVFVLAFGQLSGGPLSDRVGRQKVMLIGMFIFAASSLLLAITNSQPMFLFLRAMQAFGGGWAVVTVPALVRDRLAGNEAAKFFSLIGLLMVCAPAISPILGSSIIAFLDWRFIFAFLCLYSVITLVTVKRIVFKHKEPNVIKTRVSTWRRYSDVISNRQAIRFILIGSLAFSVLILFLTHASFIYQQHFNVSPVQFSALLSANVVMMLIVNLSNRRLLNYFPTIDILRWGLTIQSIALLILIIMGCLDAPLWLFAIPMIIAIGVLGAVSPNIQSCYMDYFQQNSGTAAALLGATKFSIAGIISGISTLLPESLVYIVLVQLFCSLGYIVVIWRK
ncbi:multidrug effflux MFS transporter [Aliiglaciecola sp. NS0011-25]|uniref:multidrug effflux MFS transporter n=1 Tax=Aliiglaciecola sp. NS0011-25 TaxID=3127654 RepID=UPI003106DFD8